MSNEEAIATLIRNNAEAFAIKKLTDSLCERCSRLENELLDKRSRLKAISVINRRNENARERREGIKALCEDD